MKIFKVIIVFILLCQFGVAQQNNSVEFPNLMVQHVPFEIHVVYHGVIENVKINGEIADFKTIENATVIEYSSTGNQNIEISVNNEVVDSSYIEPMPLWLSVIPPLLAIFLALLLQEVITSLFIGILSGSILISLYSSGEGVMTGFLTTIDTYVMNAMNDWSHIAVIVFSMTIAAVVSIISKNGGMRGVVNRLEPYAKNQRSGQLVIWFMGVLIFFDDYANTLVVGNTMRPVADRIKISREKLAYLVDSTAAPVASIAFITTWIGAELGYIETGLGHLPEISESAYSVFLMSLKYAFYPILTLGFMLMLIWMRKDFGPMLKAENKAVSSSGAGEEDDFLEDDEFKMKEGVPTRSFNAVIPVLVIIFGAVAGMWITGMEATPIKDLEGLSFFRKLSMVIGNSDSFTALLWSSLAGLVTAILLSVSQRLLTLEESIQSGLGGFKTMIPAMVILILAWGLAGVTEDMHTALFLQGLWSESLSPVFIPAVIFILSALVSFSTGSSWGTMAILYPLLLPASYHVAVAGGMDHESAMIIFYNVVSVILAGSVLGDHCSPISDTTILSSLATSCNHIQHVKTQMPYALTVGGVAILFGSIPAALGMSTLILYPVSFGLLYLIIRYFGKTINDQI